MIWRTILPVVGLLAAGCAMNPTWVEDSVTIDQLRASNKGVVILLISIERCNYITAQFAQPDGNGQWVTTDKGSVNLKLLGGNLPDEPSQITLDAGEYGFVHLTCDAGTSKHHFRTKPVERGNILSGSGFVYERPFASFSVGPGEVIDIGMLEFLTRQEGPFLQARDVFRTVVKPIPESSLRKLAARKPNIYAARVVRLAKVPPPAPSPSAPLAQQ